MTLEQLQYPVGKWAAKESYSSEEIQHNIAEVLAYAKKFKELTQNLFGRRFRKNVS